MEQELLEEAKKYFKTMTWYHGQKETPTGFYSTIGRIDEKLGSLVNTLDEADKSQTKLTEALNRITLAGVIVAGIGLLIALTNLVIDIKQLIG